MIMVHYQPNTFRPGGCTQPTAMAAPNAGRFNNSVTLSGSRALNLRLFMLVFTLCLLLIPSPGFAQILGPAERAAARAAAQSAARTSEQRAARRAAATASKKAGTRNATRVPENRRAQCRAIPQKCAGLLREDAARRILSSKYPNERIQSETYLLNRDGTRAIDPVTKQARRIDFVLFNNGNFTRRFEITSQFANKRAQLAIEQRILTRYANGQRRKGPVYVYDRQFKRMVPVSSQVSQIMRFN